MCLMSFSNVFIVDSEVKATLKMIELIFKNKDGNMRMLVDEDRVSK